MKRLLSIAMIAGLAPAAMAEPIWEVLEAPEYFHWWEVSRSDDPLGDLTSPEPVPVIANDPGIVGKGELFDLRELLVHEGVELSDDDLVLLNADTSLVYVRVNEAQTLNGVRSYLDRFDWPPDQKNFQMEATLVRVPEALWKELRDDRLLTGKERKEWLSNPDVEPILVHPVTARPGSEGKSKVVLGTPQKDSWLESRLQATARLGEVIQLEFELELAGRLHGESIQLNSNGTHTCQSGESLLRKGPPELALLVRPTAIPIWQPDQDYEAHTRRWRQQGPKLTLKPGPPLGGYTAEEIPSKFRSSVLRVQAFRVPPNIITLRYPENVAYPQVRLSEFRELLGEGNLYNLYRLWDAQGVRFPEGAWAVMNTSTATMYVRNTIDQLDLIDAYLQSICYSVTKSLHFRFSFLGPDATDRLHIYSLTGRSGQRSKAFTQLSKSDRLETETDAVIGADGITIDCILTMESRFRLADGTPFRWSSNLPLLCRAGTPMSLSIFELSDDPAKNLALKFDPQIFSLHTGWGEGPLRKASYLEKHWWDEIGAEIAESPELRIDKKPKPDFGFQ